MTNTKTNRQVMGDKKMNTGFKFEDLVRKGSKKVLKKFKKDRAVYPKKKGGGASMRGK